MIPLSFTFGSRESRNNCSAEQETAGMTLRMMTTFPKLQQYWEMGLPETDLYLGRKFKQKIKKKQNFEF